MLKLLKRDKRAQALAVLGLFTVCSMILSLYLILAQDIKTRANWHIIPGAFYYSQSKSQGFEGPAAEVFLTKAKDQHLKAIAMNPSDPRVWRNLYQILRTSDPEAAAKVQDIYFSLNPLEQISGAEISGQTP